MWSVCCNIQHLVHQHNQHNIQWSMLQIRTMHHYQKVNTANRQSIPHDNIIKRIKVIAAWMQNGFELLIRCTAWEPKRSLRQAHDGKHTLWATETQRNWSRIMWKERPLWHESELNTHRQELSRRRKKWEMLNTRDWQPPSLKYHWRRYWTPSQIISVIMQVPTIGRMGKTSLIMKMILSWVSRAKMMNPDGWSAQSLEQWRIAWSVFGRRRWSSTKWLNEAGEKRPTSSVREIGSTGQPDWRFQWLFNHKCKRIHPVLRRRHVVSQRRNLIQSRHSRKCPMWLLDLGVVKWVLGCRNPRHTKAFHPSRQPHL